MGDSRQDSGPMAGLHAVVTGGGRGIGAAIARELAAAGATVTVLGRNEARLHAVREVLERDSGRAHRAVVADVTDADAVQRAVAAAGDIDVLVNNAGAAESAAFVDTDDDLWRRMLDANLMGAVRCTRAVLPAMVARGRGRVVNVASTAGLTGYRYVSAYTAAKHALVGLTRALALETARQGVTVNAVCPGYADTELLAESVRRAVALTGRPEPEIRGVFAAANPQGRILDPAEIARAVVWLCHPGQSGVTGQCLVVDGGSLL